jgi:hypothetical protein
MLKRFDHHVSRSFFVYPFESRSKLVINDLIAVTAVTSAVVMARVISKVFNNNEFVVEGRITAAAHVLPVF